MTGEKGVTGMKGDMGETGSGGDMVKRHTMLGVFGHMYMYVYSITRV